jgi:hypothetical protein
VEWVTKFLDDVLHRQMPDKSLLSRQLFAIDLPHDKGLNDVKYICDRMKEIPQLLILFPKITIFAEF